MSEQYFTSAPTSAHEERHVQFQAGSRCLRFETDAGTFSKGHLDPGSRLLIDTVPNLTGRCADIGCGWGAIGAALAALNPELNSADAGAMEQAEIAVKYEGYLTRQQQQIDQFRRAEEALLPEDTDFMSISGLRIEARQKLQRQRPRSLGQASRMMGVSPGDVQVLMVYIEKRKHEQREAGK